MQELYSYNRKKRKARTKQIRKTISYESFTSESDQTRQALSPTTKLLKKKPLKRKKSFVKRLAFLFRNDKDSLKSETTKKRILSPVKHVHSPAYLPIIGYEDAFQEADHHSYINHIIPKGEVQPLCRCLQPVTVNETVMKTLKPGNFEECEDVEVVSICQCGCPIDRTVRPNQPYDYNCGCSSPTPKITDVSVCECGHHVDPSYFSRAESFCSCTETSVQPCDVCAKPRRRSSILYGSGDLISGSRVGESAEKHARSPDLSSEVTESVSMTRPGCWPKKRQPRITVKRKPIAKIRRKSSATASTTSRPSSQTVKNIIDVNRNRKKPRIIYDCSSGSESESRLLPDRKPQRRKTTGAGCFGKNERSDKSNTDSDSSLTSVSDLSDQDLPPNLEKKKPGVQGSSNTISYCKCDPSELGFYQIHDGCQLQPDAMSRDNTMFKKEKKKVYGLCCTKAIETESNTSSLIETAIFNNDTTICGDCKISAQSDQDVSFCKCHKKDAETAHFPGRLGPFVPFEQHVQFTAFPPCNCPGHIVFNGPFFDGSIPKSLTLPSEQLNEATSFKVNESATIHSVHPSEEIITVNEYSTSLSQFKSTEDGCGKSHTSGNSEDTSSFTTLKNNESGMTTVTKSSPDEIKVDTEHHENTTDLAVPSSEGQSAVSNIPVNANQQVIASKPMNTSQPQITNKVAVSSPTKIANQPLIANQAAIANQVVVSSPPKILNRPQIGNQPQIENQGQIANQSLTASQPQIANQVVVSSPPKIANQPLVIARQPITANQLPRVESEPVWTNQSVVVSPPVTAAQPFASQTEVTPLALKNSSPIQLMCRFCSNHTPVPESDDLLCELCVVLQNEQTPNHIPVHDQAPILMTSRNDCVLSRSDDFESPTWLRDRNVLTSPLPAINRISCTTDQGLAACDIVPMVNVSEDFRPVGPLPSDDEPCEIIPLSNRAASPLYRKNFSRRGSPILLPSINEQIQRSGATSPSPDFSETTSFTSLTKCTSLSKRSRLESFVQDGQITPSLYSGTERQLGMSEYLSMNWQQGTTTMGELTYFPYFVSQGLP